VARSHKQNAAIIFENFNNKFINKINLHPAKNPITFFWTNLKGHPLYEKVWLLEIFTKIDKITWNNMKKCTINSFLSLEIIG